MDVGLRQDFGFKHILWVYSGRRGVHCWVADDSARALTNEGRGAVADYFGVVAGNDNQAKKVTGGGYSDQILRAMPRCRLWRSSMWRRDRTADVPVESTT